MKVSCYKYELELVTGEDHPKRAVAFLITEDKKITAKLRFDRLNRNSERVLRTRFDHWVDYGPPNNKWFHGWSKTQYQGDYTKCFVFKCKKQRFYGFLCNPKESDRGFQVCVLVKHARKTKWETDEADLRKVEEIRTTTAVQKAINNYFLEQP